MMKFVRAFLLAAVLFAMIVSCSGLIEPPPVQILAKDFKFEVVDSVPSGWTTFKFVNAGHTDHFFLLDYLPDPITFEMFENEVGKPFQIIMDSLVAGMTKEDAGGLLLNVIPPWYFSDVKQLGGCGMISMGDSCNVTLNLPAGNYAIECYVKERGKFHATLGMIRPFKVTNEVSKVKPPEANVEINLTNDAIETTGEIKAGKNTFAVHYLEKPEIGIGGDVHIFRVEDDTNIDTVVYWMDWMNIEGLQNPSPVKFCGGVQEMPVGNTSYFTAYLDPGNYAFITECSPERKVVKEFTVQ